ncbi:MAG: hypothetical protein N2201_04800 [candidate division WOR-3 bacterium]|nr:hypothetical protein [candidate division WOR-3 bacterium]
MIKFKTSIIAILFISTLIFNIIYASNDTTKQITTTRSIRKKAIWASALVPGWGQGMLKNNTKSEIMLWTEAGIWLCYAGFSWYGSSLNQDAKLFAGIYANANTKIKSNKYYRALEKYDNTEEYNNDIRREARELYPDDTLAQKNYLSKYGYFGDSIWDWGSDSLRYVYWEKRKSARTALTRAGFFLAGALLNRIISVIDCTFFTPDKRNTLGIAPNSEHTGIGLVYRF